MSRPGASAARSRPIRAHARIPLLPVAARPTGRPAVCSLCGSRGFNLHGWTIKAVADPSIDRATVTRFRCKGCRHVVRQYPPGIGSGRPSLALRQLCRLLACAGLSQRSVAQVTDDLGHPVSPTSVRRLVSAVPPPGDPGQQRMELARSGPSRLEGPDVVVRLRIEAPSPVQRTLVVDAAGDESPEVVRRLASCGQEALNALLPEL